MTLIFGHPKGVLMVLRYSSFGSTRIWKYPSFKSISKQNWALAASCLMIVWSGIGVRSFSTRAFLLLSSAIKRGLSFFLGTQNIEILYCSSHISDITVLSQALLCSLNASWYLNGTLLLCLARVLKSASFFNLIR